MIVFGNYLSLLSVFDFNRNDIDIYNINSPLPYGVNISCIIPLETPYGLYPESYEYDMFYAEYLATNGVAFGALMNIMYSDYIGKTVLVLIDTSSWSRMYIDVLMKYINDRYGVIVNIIQDPDDIIVYRDTEFSIMGRKQFEIDKECFVNANFNQFMINEDRGYYE